MLNCSLIGAIISVVAVAMKFDIKFAITGLVQKLSRRSLCSSSSNSGSCHHCCNV